jgi:hypothetical protein
LSPTRATRQLAYILAYLLGIVVTPHSSHESHCAVEAALADTCVGKFACAPVTETGRWQRRPKKSADETGTHVDLEEITSDVTNCRLHPNGIGRKQQTLSRRSRSASWRRPVPKMGTSQFNIDNGTAAFGAMPGFVASPAGASWSEVSDSKEALTPAEINRVAIISGPIGVLIKCANVSSRCCLDTSLQC